MHYFVPKRCTESNKIMYHDKQLSKPPTKVGVNAAPSYGYIVANSVEHGI